MTLKRGMLAFAGCLVAILVGLLWWPQTIKGRVVDGVSGAPIDGATIATTGIIYKLLAPLHALAWGNASSSTSRLARTDHDGRFSATFFAGFRLKHAILYMTKRGFVIAPVIEGGSGTANLHAEDLASESTFPAWPVSTTAALEIGRSYGRVPADGKEHQVEFGRAHALWIRADAAGQMSEEQPVPASIRWVSAQIQETAGFALVAPQEGYHTAWNGTIDCSRRQPTPRFFAVRSDGNHFGAFSIDMQGLCFGLGEISISYRLVKEAGVRSVAKREELELATRSVF